MKNIIYIITALITGSALFISCGSEGESKTEPEKKLQAVKTAEIITQEFRETYKVVGTVKPYQTAKISSEEGGLITYMPFDKGSRVGRGQTLVRLKKDTDFASFEQAETQYELAKSNFERTEKLYNESVSTEQDYTNAKFQLELAEKTLNLIETRLSKSYVTSPISGIVDEKYMSRGEVCGPGTPILNIVDVSRVKISAGIPERYLSEIKKGSQVKITFDVYPGEEFTGTVNYISPTLSVQNRTFEIEMVLPNKGGRLKPEMSANIIIEKSVIVDAIVLPQDLLIDFGSEKFVYVLENGVARKRSVLIGGRDNNNVQIISGLNKGEILIKEGFQSVADGDKVEIIN
ncbi:MAG TPA: efflux RND transporter periplasmic adaptor subunit [Ignavibacteria bacterium]|nr:efflux RND transporter periplasmic adaptor subunit [Ignavibacteria bacterium]HRJ99722.1 efflux RND transporter periplasmic adaptor subunit [Ignavibacteria bacterium]